MQIYTHYFILGFFPLRERPRNQFSSSHYPSSVLVIVLDCIDYRVVWVVHSLFRRRRMSPEFENNFIEALRNYGILRQKKVLEPIAVITNRYLENNSLFHIALCIATLFVIIATYAEVRWTIDSLDVCVHIHLCINVLLRIVLLCLTGVQYGIILFLTIHLLLWCLSVLRHVTWRCFHSIPSAWASVLWYFSQRASLRIEIRN